MKELKSNNWCWFSVYDGQLFSGVNVTINDVLEEMSYNYCMLEFLTRDDYVGDYILTDEQLITLWNSFINRSGRFCRYEDQEYKIYLIQDDQLIECWPTEEQILTGMREWIEFIKEDKEY